jgi:hypothetical protein
MKEINTNTIEQALAKYTETVSPSKDNLMTILSQIPERKKNEKGRAVRSPYIWLEVTQFVTLCFVVIAIIPTLLTLPTDGTLGYTIETQKIDAQIEKFEISIDTQDYENSLLDSSSL